MSGRKVSRRALLGAVVAAPLVGGAARLTPDQVRGDEREVRGDERGVRGDGKGDGPWQRAFARLRAAEAEMRAVERATAGGTAEEEEALEGVYMARLGDFLTAIRRVMRVRAPDLAALAVKIELAIDQEVGSLSGGELCLATVRRDVRRLMR
ncbi:MAG: hypothetical protein ABIR60_07405 [Allosphingosinicella sp.]